MRDQETALQRRYDRLKLLHDFSKEIHAHLEQGQVLPLLVRKAVELLKAKGGAIILLNPTTGLLETEAAEGSDQAQQKKWRLGEGIIGLVGQSGQAVRVGDLRSKTASGFHALVPITGWISVLVIPVEMRGEVRGVLLVHSDLVDAFGEQDQELLEQIASHASAVINNAWSYEQVRLKARWFETLVSVSQAVNSTLSLDDTLKVITREAATLMGAGLSSLLLLDETGQWLNLRASHGAGDAYLGKPRLAVTDSLIGSVIRRKKPLQVDNVQTSSRYQHVQVAQAEGLVALLSVPLLYYGTATGVLNVYTREPHLFSNEETRALLTLAELSAMAIERARLYERVLDLEDHLRTHEKLSALGLLAAEVAHEIRNPLTVMKLLYHSMDLKFPPGDPRSEDARIFGEKMNLLNRIVEQVLDFARSAEPRPAPVDLNRLIENLALLTRHKMQHHGIEVVRNLAADLPVVRADSSQIEQVMLNLALNALEAMPHGGRLLIATRAKAAKAGRPPGTVTIEFVDTGVGMSQEQRHGAFSSLLSSSKPRGTGLGLAIVNRIVEAHHGRVEIESEAGRGSTVRVTLPVGEGPASVAQ